LGWITDIPELMGILTYGESAAEAISKAKILSLGVMGDRPEDIETESMSINLSLPITA
jgi:hypothetical protein